MRQFKENLKLLFAFIIVGLTILIVGITLLGMLIGVCYSIYKSIPAQVFLGVIILIVIIGNVVPWSFGYVQQWCYNRKNIYET